MVFKEKKPKEATGEDCLNLFYEKVRRGQDEKMTIGFFEKLGIDIFNVKENQTEKTYILLLIAL